MKVFKLSKVLMVVFALFAGVATFTSCEDDPCEDTICNNGGICVEGNCDCADGFGGATCDDLDRDVILGNSGADATWEVVETCNVTGGATYTVDVKNSSANDQAVLVDDFGGYGDIDGAVMTVNDDDVTIASQTIAGYTIVGSGTISGGGSTMSISYTITDALMVSETCTGTWTKQ